MSADIDIFVSPAKVEGLENIIEIAGGGAHSLALRSDGTVVAWGANCYGQLGNAINSSSDSFVLVSNLTGVTAIAAGGEHSLAMWYLACACLSVGKRNLYKNTGLTL